MATIDIKKLLQSLSREELLLIVEEMVDRNDVSCLENMVQQLSSRSKSSSEANDAPASLFQGQKAQQLVNDVSATSGGVIQQKVGKEIKPFDMSM
jgi:hypothetical protein